MAYHQTSADLYMVGGGSQMYRLNLEQGRYDYFMNQPGINLYLADF